MTAKKSPEKSKSASHAKKSPAVKSVPHKKTTEKPASKKHPVKKQGDMPKPAPAKSPAAKPTSANGNTDHKPNAETHLDPVFPPAKKSPSKPKPRKSSLDDLPLDLEEREELAEEEKEDLALALTADDDAVLETSFVPTDTSERYILVVDEEGQRRSETALIISQILPNAVVEVADDPEEALEMMSDCEFDTYVVNFLMPGYSASPFVKAVANHPDHPLLIGFAADKISDAVDPKKGLKIIPLKRLFDLDASANLEGSEGDGAEG